MHILNAPQERVITHAHLFCGIGGGALGIQRARPRVGNITARYECLGGIDVDPGVVADFTKLVGVPATQIDLFSRDQYRRFHGHEPPADWREATPQDIQRAFQYRRPDLCITSPPCKGFSGLLAESVARSDKYAALNELTVRGFMLLLTAFADDPIPLICMENVPRIATRGRPLIDEIRGVLDAFGYASVESMHDCGELGGLAQSRKRFLLVARHKARVPPFLYEPPKQRLKGVGEVLGQLPLPGDPRGGPMHRVPALQFQTWIRLAFVEAGKDWRSLNRLRVENGVLADYGIVPDRPLRNGAFGVRRWEEASGAVAGETLPTNGNYAVADPRAVSSREGSGFLGVRGWNQPSGAVIGNSRPGAGAFCVADIRIDGHPKSVQLGVRPWNKPAPTIKGDVSVGGGPYAVADPRTQQWSDGQLGVNAWDQSAPTLTCQRSPLQGRFSVADPRARDLRDATLGVVAFDAHVGAITANAEPTTGRFSVADPRPNTSGPRFNNVYRVVAFDQPSPAVTGQGGNSAGAVADPRGGPTQHTGGKYRVTRYDEASNCVIGASTTGQGAYAVADPRTGYATTSHSNKLALVGWDGPSRTVTGANQVQGGALSVADPRPACLSRGDRRDFTSTQFYGVRGWGDTSLAVPGSTKHDNGPWSVADPRPAEGEYTATLPGPTDRLVAVIKSLDGTWHRPFTSMELAALQGLVDPETLFTLSGASDSAHRERIGNCIPAGAATAIGEVMGQCLLLAQTGQTFQLSDTPIWVQPLAVGLSIDCPGLDSAVLH